MKDLAVSMILLLASLPLISWGFSGDRTLLWQIGLAVFALGALIPPVARFFKKGDK